MPHLKIYLIMLLFEKILIKYLDKFNYKKTQFLSSNYQKLFKHNLQEENI
jgi:hypothetical protein